MTTRGPQPARGAVWRPGGCDGRPVSPRGVKSATGGDAVRPVVRVVMRGAWTRTSRSITAGLSMAFSMTRRNAISLPLSGVRVLELQVHHAERRYATCRTATPEASQAGLLARGWRS